METEVNQEQIIYTLKQYVPVEYWDMFDWNIIIQRAEQVEKDIKCFDLFLYKAYFNNHMIPVQYKNQHIIDGMVFLDLNEDSSKGAGTYHYIGDMPL